MMETADSIVKDILAELIVDGQEQPVEAIDFITALRYLNRYMLQLDADGVVLGYTKMSDPSDVITIPDGAINGAIYNTALQIADRYDIQVDPNLRIKARDSYDVMAKLGVEIIESSFPDTLPLGSGNEYDSRDDKFYHQSPDYVERETGGVIQLEEGTISEQSS